MIERQHDLRNRWIRHQSLSSWAIASEQTWKALTRPSSAEEGDRDHVELGEGPANTSIRSCVMQGVQNRTDNRVLLVARMRSGGRKAPRAFESRRDLNKIFAGKA